MVSFAGISDCPFAFEEYLLSCLGFWIDIGLVLVFLCVIVQIGSAFNAYLLAELILHSVNCVNLCCF